MCVCVYAYDAIYKRSHNYTYISFRPTLIPERERERDRERESERERESAAVRHVHAA